MKIYFACSSGEIREHLQDYNLVRNIVLKQGHVIVDDWIERAFNQKSQTKALETVKKSIREESIEAIGRSDVVIADVSFSSASDGFQVGLALSKKIPVLCIYSEEFGEKAAPQVIQAIKSPLLLIKSYTNKSLKNVIKDFFDDLPENKLIKFNFIITPKISEYLNWGSEKSDISKSDFLREIIEKIIDSDPEFHK